MALQDDVRNLASVPALRDLDEDALRLIAFGAEAKIFRAGDVLFKRGDISDGGYVLFSGSIVLDIAVQNTTVLRPPALIGATALITETVRPATATAREPSSVLKISRDLFRRVLSEYPESAARLRRSFAGRIADLQADLGAARDAMISEP